MPPSAQQGFRRRFRLYFRRCRVCVLFFLFLLIGGLTYLNLIGLPQFLKTRLVSGLRARGVDLRFTRLRLRWYHGLVAENIRVGRADDPAGPQLSIGEADLKFDRAALHALRFQVSSLVFHDGRLVVPLASTNETAEPIVLDSIATELRLLPDDQWRLEHFQALCLGARIHLSGTLTNASAVRNWRFQPATNQPPGVWQTRLREVAKAARHMQFSRTPEIFLQVHGDARAPAGISADLYLTALGADTEWGKLEKLLFIAELNHPSGTNGVGQSELKLQMNNARTPWGQAQLGRLYVRWAQAVTNPLPANASLDCELFGVDTPWGNVPHARFTGRTDRSEDGTGPLRTELTLDSGVLKSEWLQVETNRFTAQVIHSPDAILPRQIDWQWTAEGPRSRWGGARSFLIKGRATRVTPETPPDNGSARVWWKALEPFALDWDAQVDGVASTNVVADRVAFSGKWRAPELVIEKLHADLYDRQLDASVRIHAVTREARVQTSFDFDVRKIESLLTPLTQHWLSQYDWTEPPKVNAQVRVILPDWTNGQPDWRADVLPTLQIEGELRAGAATFRGVQVLSARSRFAFSNSVWSLPDFVATRPEGQIEFAHTSNIQNHDYHFRFRGQLDPLVLKPLFEGEMPRGFDYFKFHEPLLLEGDVWGQWRDAEKFGARAHVSATNFVFREVPIGELDASVQFTNRFLTATDVMIQSDGPLVSASGVGYDIATQRIYLTNAFSTMDPKLITHAIGPQTEKTLSPYTFAEPPMAHVNGWVEVRHGKQSDLRFEISGGPFTYWKFNVPHIAGTVRWVDEMVAITNLQADFYHGKLGAALHLDCTIPHTADFSLRAAVTNVDLHQLMIDVSSPTNRLEGTLSGNLTVTKANSGNWESWNGFGNAEMRDGFLWDMPLFGIFSPVLNAVAPGLGNSRVSGGNATFTLTNSVMHTDDMEIRSPAMRLSYKGTVDFKGNVNARVEARLLRDAWVIGPIVSLVLSPLTKLFEYKVTGTLHEPHKEPLYIPKPLMFPFHPFRTIKELFIEEKPEKPNPPSTEKSPPR